MDVFCARCGEPWDTRGLHHSNFDMGVHQVFQLLNGVGCPCCNTEEHEFKDENLRLWARSVNRASEGQLALDETDAVGVKLKGKTADELCALSPKQWVDLHPVSYSLIGA